MIGTASRNVVEQNSVSGNTNGVLLAPATRDTIVRQNTIVGNPAIQIGNTQGDAQAADILNLSPEGAAMFDRNHCVTAVNAPCPTVTENGNRRPPPQ